MKQSQLYFTVLLCEWNDKSWGIFDSSSDISKSIAGVFQSFTLCGKKQLLSFTWKCQYYLLLEAIIWDNMAADPMKRIIKSEEGETLGNCEAFGC